MAFKSVKVIKSEAFNIGGEITEEERKELKAVMENLPEWLGSLGKGDATFPLFLPIAGEVDLIWRQK